MESNIFLQTTELLTGLKLLLGLTIVLLAAIGYRRNASRPMLFLGSGIAMMTVISTVITISVTTIAGPSSAVSMSMLSEVVGMCLILYSIVSAKRR